MAECRASRSRVWWFPESARRAVDVMQVWREKYDIALRVVLSMYVLDYSDKDGMRLNQSRRNINCCLTPSKLAEAQCLVGGGPFNGVEL